MRPARNLLTFLALASFSFAFAEDSGVAARIHEAKAASTKVASTTPKAPSPAINTQCPAMGGKVDVTSSTVVVNNRQYRICCQECGDKIKADPRHYFNRDGTLTGAWENNSTVNHL